jgi:hypothetical protein
MGLYLEKTKSKRKRGMAQVVKHMPQVQGALSSIPSITKKKKKKEKSIKYGLGKMLLQDSFIFKAKTFFHLFQRK